MSQAGQRKTSRRDLSRNEHFTDVSPELGTVDESAFDDLMSADPDAALALLADMTGALDEGLRALARRLAASIFVDIAASQRAAQPGIGRLRSRPFCSDGGDLDLDGSTDPIAVARASGHAVDPDELRIVTWQRPTLAICLLVDRSGSMTGEPLATAALAAAATAFRTTDCSVIAFAKDAIVLKSLDQPKPAESVVVDLLTLRGFGTTDISLALRAAATQLSRSRATRKVTILLSDCRSTVQDDPTAAAASLDELVILAPADDLTDATTLAHQTGARLFPVDGPSSVPTAISAALSR